MREEQFFKTDNIKSSSEGYEFEESCSIYGSYLTEEKMLDTECLECLQTSFDREGSEWKCCNKEGKSIANDSINKETDL